MKIQRLVMGGGILFCCLLSSNIFAQDLDEEIQRLEKQNKLLELKKKQKQLQNELQDDNLSSDTTQAKTESNQKDLSKAKEKSGFFIGVEGVLGSVQISQKDPDLTNGVISLNLNKTSNNFAFDGGLLLGYQKYFGESAKHGLKISTHLYSGVGYELSLKGLSTISSRSTSVLGDISTTVNYIPIKVGIDIKYLWDFLEKGKSALGLNVGFGYEFDYYIGNFSLEFKSSVLDAGGSVLIDNIASTIYPTIGLHYVYNKHHSFEINYRFGGMITFFGSKTSNPSLKTTSKISGANYVMYFTDGIKHTIAMSNFFIFNYTYKF
ncbi:hypothetical protein CQA57_00445 [Helicobacter anseris]|uniref:Outer membrane beta-barrel protein n=1 Tax=Helicobacter anseris TaxID=375926 RepID=A0A3D8JBV5_9HELI|nr:hypothetical protein [Helicobacter anseris]RDU74556.1 hypothetical protein CQA57_00445 [Helicobacter anseris]